MNKTIVMSIVILSLTGCGNLGARLGMGKDRPASVAPSDVSGPEEDGAVETVLAPQTAAPRPPASATSVEALDTTTAEQRAAAAAPAAAPTKSLGKTVVSLGSPTEPGLWLKTPLVTEEQQGRVSNPANGKSSLVTLIPIVGPATAGSRMSLAAMRIIDVSLTELTEVDVALGG